MRPRSLPASDARQLVRPGQAPVAGPAAGPADPPGKRPRPLAQPLAPGVEMVIDCALTAPVVPAGPTALAHLPTTRSEAEADVRWVKVVEEVRVTATLVVALVVGLVSLTVAVDPLTAVTRPDATPNWPGVRGRKVAPPPGRSPDPVPGNPPPDGAPPGVPLPGPPRPRPPRPPAQEPETGWEMETVVAVTGPPNACVLDDEVEVGFPNAETHEPTVRLEAAAATVCSKVVVGV
jgi:hypothetical protein